MRVLGIETSTYSGSVALVEGDVILGEILFNLGPAHSEKTLPMIDWLLKEIGIKGNEIDGIAVSKGPGSFTSLRVGVSTAKGLAYSLGIPVIGVSSLEILAQNLLHTRYPICTIIDARKRELYAAFFRGSDDKVIRQRDDHLTTPEDLVRILNEKIIFIGNGAVIYREFLESSLGNLALFTTSSFNYQRASNCAKIGIERLNVDYKNGYSEFSPQYLRKADAEIYKER